ncbi:MAG: LURP-one-related family protein [Clostridia bacterium]|nr:LURP-one-related family protein [Clostridia bacterium]MBQ7316318.1 LURP-one-related family protein [Clostridia bacterium]
MRLLIREKIFTWADKFTVTDEHGEARYTVEGQFFSWGKKLRVYDLQGREVAYIEQKVMSFLPRYCVYVGEHLIGEVTKEISFFHPRYSVRGAGWDVEGEFWEHNYTVFKNGRPIVSIDKDWFAWGDCYTLDIADPQDEIQALALVLAIDCAMETGD